MSGRLIGVVGPSGVGKDTLMRALADEQPEFGLVRRVITRAPDLGGEIFDAVSEAEFDRLLEARAFCIHWPAHGLRYGIREEERRRVEGGEARLVNLSRRVLADVAAAFPRFLVLNVTARPETLAARLAGRGRESAADIEGRLARADLPLPDGVPVVTIENDGPLADAVQAALTALRPVRA